MLSLGECHHVMTTWWKELDRYIESFENVNKKCHTPESPLGTPGSGSVRMDYQKVSDYLRFHAKLTRLKGHSRDEACKSNDCSA